MKTCIICGAEFEPKNKQQILCGKPECARERHKAAMQKYYEKCYVAGVGWIRERLPKEREAPEPTLARLRMLARLRERDRQYEARFGKCDGAVRGRIPYGGVRPGKGVIEVAEGGQ